MKEKISVKKRAISLLFAGALTAGFFTACGAKENTQSLTVALVAPAVNQTAVDKYNGQLKGETLEGLPVELIAMMAGEGAANQVAGATGLMQFTTMLAAGELDVVVSDLENAARNARSEAFLPLSDYLSAEEIAALGNRALDFRQTDEDGNLTEERTAACGIRLEPMEVLQEVFGNTEVGVFLVANTERRAAAESAVRLVLENT